MRRALLRERRDLEFVGVETSSTAGKGSGGWVQPGQLAALRSVNEQDADPGHVAILQALVNRDRLEFLG